MKHTTKLLFLFAVLALSLTACYGKSEIRADQVGIQVNEGKIEACVGPGVYEDWDWYADLIEVSQNTVSVDVTAPSVATSDKQPVGVAVTVFVRRLTDCENLANMLSRWNAVLTSDDALKANVTSNTSEAIKNAVVTMTLDQMLTDRNTLADLVTKSLAEDASEYSGEIVNITINDIILDPEYEQLLLQKARLTEQINIANRQQDVVAAEAATDRIRQEEAALTYAAQLEAEQAKTEVEVEIASREGEKIAAQYQVYADNPQAFEIKRLELLRNVLGDKAAVYFVDSVEDLMLLLGGGQTTPIPVEPEGSQ